MIDDSSLICADSCGGGMKVVWLKLLHCATESLTLCEPLNDITVHVVVCCNTVVGSSSQSLSPADVQDLLNNVRVCQSAVTQLHVFVTRCCSETYSPKQLQIINY